MIKNFKIFNEGLLDKMTPKTNQDMLDSLEKMSPYKALYLSNEHNLEEGIKLAIERTKPVVEKLINDTKDFKNYELNKFLKFISEWLKEQGGDPYIIKDKFEKISKYLSDGDSPTYYTESTIDTFKKLVIGFAIDEATYNNDFSNEDMEDGEYDGEGDGDYWTTEEDEEEVEMGEGDNEGTN